MRLGYGKGKDAAGMGYKVINNVEGVDIDIQDLDCCYEICIRDHGYRITKEGKEMVNQDWKNLT